MAYLNGRIMEFLDDILKQGRVRIDPGGDGIGVCIQKKEELEWMLEKVMQISPRENFLEVGVFLGGMFLIWTKFFDRVCGVDKCIEAREGITLLNIPEFRHGKDLMVEGMSQNPNVIERVKKNFPVLDGVFIDGSHAYNDV